MNGDILIILTIVDRLTDSLYGKSSDYYLRDALELRDAYKFSYSQLEEALSPEHLDFITSSEDAQKGTILYILRQIILDHIEEMLTT